MQTPFAQTEPSPGQFWPALAPAHAPLAPQ
jgi:hypothetical protein